MMKKLVALLMALAMLCSSIAAFADPAPVPSGAPKDEPTETPTDEPTDVPATDEPTGAPIKYGPIDGFDRYMETPNDEVHKHGWVNDEASEAPVCVYDGYYYVLCADCGQYYKYVREGADDHAWRDEKPSLDGIDPKRTCTVDGVMHYSNYCTVCQKTIEWTEILPAYGHSYRDENGELTVEGEVIREADCTNNEIRRFTCTRIVDGVKCGYYEDIEIKDTAKGHSWEQEATHDHVIEQVTCAKDGSYGAAVICDVCGAVNPDSVTTVEKIDALDHTEEWLSRIDGIDEDGEIKYEYVPDTDKLLKDLYKELKELGVTLPEFKDIESIDEVIEAIEEQEIPADVLIKVLDNVTVDMYPQLFYTLPDGTVLDLSKVTSIPAYEIPITIQVGDGSEGSENPLREVTVYGRINSTIVTYNAPTCTATGSIILSCTACDDEYVINLPKLEHIDIAIRGVRGINDLEYTVIKDCTKANSVLQQCIFCGRRYNQAIEPAKKHTIKLDSEEFDAADLKKGDGNCMIVGFVQQKEWDDAPITYYVNEDMDDTMAQFGFDYLAYKNRVQVAFSKIATCRDFDVIVKCAVPFCQHTEVIHVDAYTDHRASTYIVEVDPTCTVDGYKKFNCADCGKPHTVTDPAPDHVRVNGKTTQEPTCTEVGYREIICSVCNEVVGTEEIPALGHHWIEKDTGANCAEGKIGLRYEYCPRCGLTRNEESYEGHKIGTVTGEKKATCTEGGMIYGVCEICHNDVEVPTGKLGHTYEALNYKHVHYTKDNPTPDGHYCEDATCKPGAEHGNICWHVCTRCGDEKKVDDGRIPEHSMFKTVPGTDGTDQVVLNRFVINKLPTCTTPGDAEYQCSLCGAHVTGVVLPNLPHNYQITFDEETGAYNLVCTKMDNTTLGRTNLYNRMVESSYKNNEQVAQAIIDMLALSTGEKIKGTGCGDVQPIEIRKTEYSVAQISATQGQVVLAEGALPIKGDVWVRIMWKYAFPSGETFTAIDCRAVNMTDATVGTFRLANGQVGNAELQSIFVEVVSDANAADMQKGTYTRYGYQLF